MPKKKHQIIVSSSKGRTLAYREDRRQAKERLKLHSRNTDVKNMLRNERKLNKLLKKKVADKNRELVSYSTPIDNDNTVSNNGGLNEV